MAYTNDPAQQSNQLPISIDFPEDEKDLREVLTTSYKKTVDSVNTKIGGLFTLEEVANFERWFTVDSVTQTRNGYRKTFKLNPNSLTFAHGIQSLKQITDYRAIVKTSDGDFRKVPYVHITDITKQISMRVTETQVIIENGSTAPTIKSGIVVLEYLKQG